MIGSVHKFVGVASTALLCCFLSVEDLHAQAQGPSSYSNGQTFRPNQGVTEFVPSGNSPGRSNLSIDFQKAAPPATPPQASPFQLQPAAAPTSTTRTSSFSSTPATSSSSNSGSATVSVKSCTVEFVDVVDFPALESGDLIAVDIREGDTVPNGKTIAVVNQKLLQLEMAEGRERLQLALERAQSDISIRAQQKQYELARNEYEKTRKLASKGSMSQSEKERAKFEAQQAALLIEQAKQERRQAGIEYQIESARMNRVRERIARHSVSVGFDGVVVKMFKKKGEWVTGGDPIAQIARMDEMFVQGLIRYDDHNTYDLINKPVVVTVKLAGDKDMKFNGTIVSIPVEDAGSGEEYFVKAKIRNKLVQGQWVLRKDATVSMEIDLQK